MPGSKSVAGERTVYIGTWEDRMILNRSIQGVEEMTRVYGYSVVGLTHSRGVNRVMPIEPKTEEALEGVSSLKQRDGENYAVH